MGLELGQERVVVIQTAGHVALPQWGYEFKLLVILHHRLCSRNRPKRACFQAERLAGRAKMQYDQPA